MTIPISPPQIRPDVVSGGQNEGLTPLIQALEFYKKSKLDEQRNAIDAARTASDVNLQGAQADRLRADLKSKQDAQEAWDKTVAGAPAALQPALRMLNGLQGLDAPLQRVVAPMLLKAMGLTEKADPEGLTRLAAFLHLGLPMDVSGLLAGIPMRDIADKNPSDPNAIALPKNMLRWQYTPPGNENQSLNRELRAQGMVVRQSVQDDAVVQRDLTKQKELIAQQVIRARLGGVPPLPGTPIQFDPNDPEMALALGQYRRQHHYDTRLQLNKQNRAAANERINAVAQERAGAISSPTANLLQQTVDLMSNQQGQPAPADTIPHN